MEDLVNRNMRNNLIIKGINESENESVKDKVVHYLHSLDVKGNADYLFNKIERAHRGSKKVEGQPRHIYIRFYSTEDVSHFHELARKTSARNKNNTIKVDFQFSANITARRNKAMVKCRDLLNVQKISAGYLVYSAKLMAKIIGANKFTLIQEF